MLIDLPYADIKFSTDILMEHVQSKVRKTDENESQEESSASGIFGIPITFGVQ